ncbi:MAG: hypothetical protein KDD47_17310 [Acidobacteria bacterium]|nr:hypothetical protein [Acidobacteriota bacterium]
MAKDLEMPAADYERIARLIESDDSPVGIDAKKTHVLILHKLGEIERRLARLEEAAQRRP